MRFLLLLLAASIVAAESPWATFASTRAILISEVLLLATMTFRRSSSSDSNDNEDKITAMQRFFRPATVTEDLPP